MCRDSTPGMLACNAFDPGPGVVSGLLDQLRAGADRPPRSPHADDPSPRPPSPESSSESRCGTAAILRFRAASAGSCRQAACPPGRGTDSDPWPSEQVSCSYGPLSNRRRVIRGSIAAELSTFWEKAGATRTFLARRRFVRGDG